jgi:hypothetical protein
MEEVRKINLLTLPTFSFSYSTPYLFANMCVQTPIRFVNSFGLILDASRQPIPNATISFTDQRAKEAQGKSGLRGRFAVEMIGKKIRINATAVGFASIFGEVEQAAFANSCSKPIYIVMQVGGDICSSISNRKSDLPKVKKD